MNQYLIFCILGLGGGALAAGLAQGLIVAYRGSGVVNLAIGAMAGYTAYTFVGLTQTGDIVLPPLPNPLALIEGVADWFGAELSLPDLPTSVGFSDAISIWVALPISLAFAALLGLLSHLLVFRPLRNAPPIARVIGSVGLMLGLQAMMALRFGSEARPSPAVLPRNILKVGDLVVPVDRLILAGTVIVVASALTVLYHRTRFGLATVAAAENERGAILTGLSPDRLAARNWMLSSVIAGAVAIPFAAITNVTPTNFTLYILPALGAALVGKLTSFGIAAAAGLAIGVVQSLTVQLQGDLSWFPRVGADQGIPLLVILIVLTVGGGSLPKRGSIVRERLPAFPQATRRWPGLLGGVPLAAAALIFLPFDFRNAVINSLVGVLVALSVVVITGMAGQVSLMQMVLAGVGALGLTRLATDWGVPFPVAPLLAALGASAIAVVIGTPALRVRGASLVVATLAAAAAFEAMILKNTSILRLSDAQGTLPAPELFGLKFGINEAFPFGSKGTPSPAFGLFVLTVVAVLCLAVTNLRSNRWGRTFLSVRSNERAAASLGVNVSGAKLRAMAIAGFIAGLAGAVNAYKLGGVTADPYVALASVTALAIAYLGGISGVSGAIAAGVLTTGGVMFKIVDSLFHVGEYQHVIAGFGLVLATILHPEGFAGLVRNLPAHFRRREPAAEPVAAPAALSVVRAGGVK